MPFQKENKLGIGNKANSGRTLSLEHKKKISISLKKTDCYTRFTVGVVPWNKGKRHTKISGENHYNWKEDRAQLAKNQERNNMAYKEWRKEVKARDGWKCKMSTNECSGKLEVHHILGWSLHPELRYQINNGITLCHAHHPKKRKEEAELSPYFQELVAENN